MKTWVDDPWESAIIKLKYNENNKFYKKFIQSEI